MISKLSCHYCKCNLQILYNSTLEKKQWSLDRVDNDIGHNTDNVVISCLECNLQRRRTDMKKFEFTKYFDVSVNEWDLEKYPEKINQAREKCLDNVETEIKLSLKDNNTKTITG